MRIISAVLMTMVVFAPTQEEPKSTSRSTEAVQELASALRARQIDAFAAAHPDDLGRFVAALYYPGVQLLMIGSAYSAPQYLEHRLQEGKFRDVYVELHTAGDPDGQLFIEDLLADGLQPANEPGEPFDLAASGRKPRIVYNGDWRAQGLSKEQYDALFAEHDAAYAEMLGILVEVLEGTNTGSN